MSSQVPEVKEVKEIIVKCNGKFHCALILILSCNYNDPIFNKNG